MFQSIIVTIGTLLISASISNSFTLNPSPSTISSTTSLSAYSKQKRSSTSSNDRGSENAAQFASKKKRIETKSNANTRIIPTQQLPNNNPINCIHFGTCPGCVVNDDVTQVDIIQSAKRFFASSSIQRHIIPSPNTPKADFYKVVIPSPTTQWRTQAKLAVSVRSTWGRDGCIFGLYERKSHNVMEIDECAVHHPAINQAVRALTEATRTVKTVAFDERTGTGALRYVQIQVEKSMSAENKSPRVCLTLVWNADVMKDCQPGLSRLVKELRKIEPNLWHSVWCHLNTGIGNNIFARGNNRWNLVDGPEFVREVLPGSDPDRKDGLLFFTPNAFRQGNMDGFSVIAKHVAGVVPSGSKVCELYAGVGLLGLTALNDAYHREGNWDSEGGLTWLRCSDENDANPRCFERAVGSMPTEVTGRLPWKQQQKKQYTFNKNGRRVKNNNRNKRTPTIQNILDDRSNLSDFDSSSEDNNDNGKVSYMVASASKALYEGQGMGANVLIVDPPRKGLEEEVLAQLCKPFNPNQLPMDDLDLVFEPLYNVNLVNEVKTLIYVSCGFDALARDSERLLSGNAGWKLESCTGYVLFPGSNHVETVAIFQRRGRIEERP